MLVRFEEPLILLGSLIDLPLLALSEGPKSEIVELCNIQVAQLGNTAHFSKNNRRSLLKRSNLIHQGALQFSVFDLDDNVCVQVDLIVEVFKLLNDLWLFVKLFLKLLDEVKDTLVGVLESSSDPDCLVWVLNKSKLKFAGVGALFVDETRF